MKIKAIVVDDEPRAIDILDNYASRINEFDIVGRFLYPKEAIQFLQNNNIDLILLDINMPEISGFTFLSLLTKQPLIVFTTAYSEFAVESYEVNAVDYLVKPIPFARFTKAIDKAKGRLGGFHPTPELPKSISFRVDGKDILFGYDDIDYFQSMGNYIKIFCKGKIWLSQITTKELESKLPSSKFIRIHKSYIVNRSKIESFAEDEITLSGKQLPIGMTFKVYFKTSFH